MTHKKIAEIANVSVSTVSKALSGSKEINARLADKIIDTAIELGYFKEKGQRKLENLKKKSPVIAVICPEIVSIFYSSVITMLKDTIEENGGQISVYISDFSKDKLNGIIRTLIVRGSADGVISFESPTLGFLPHIPILCFSTSEVPDWCDCAGYDADGVMHDAVKHLKSLGHTKIGFIGETLTMSKYESFKNAVIGCGLEFNADYCRIENCRFEKIGKNSAENLIKSKSGATAYIAAYDEIALSFVHELEKNGISVPDDISVMGINDIPSSSYAQTPLTTVNFFDKKQLNEAVKKLLEKIFTGSTEQFRIKLSHRLIIRESTGVAKNDRQFIPFR